MGAWQPVFSWADLRLVADAGLTGAEALDVLLFEEMPDRNTLAVMAALRLNTARV